MTGTRWWQLLQWGLFLFVIVMLAIIITRYNSALSALSWHASYIIPFLFVSVLSILFRSLLVGELAAYFDVQLRFGEMLGLTIVSVTLSECLPASAGTLIRPAYLWRVHGLSVSASVVMVFTNSIMITATSSGLGIVGLVLVGRGSSAITALFAALLVLCTIPFFVSPRWLSTLLGRRFERVLGAWQQVHGNPRHSCRVLALSMAVCFLEAVRFWLAFLLIGVDFSFAGALIVSGVALLMAYLAIVPGALGFIEASVAGVSVLLGHAAVHGIAGTLVFRAGVLLFTVPTMPIFYFRLTREMRLKPVLAQE
jgi:uncharacterized membrane protein YbhN (UPF0104 family)